MCLLAAVRSTFVQHLMVMRLIPRVPSLFRQLNALIDWGTRLFFFVQIRLLHVAHI